MEVWDYSSKTSSNWLLPYAFNNIVFIYKNHIIEILHYVSGGIGWFFSLASVLHKNTERKTYVNLQIFKRTIKLNLTPYYGSSGAMDCFGYYFIKKVFINNINSKINLIYATLCHSKPVWFSFFCRAQKERFWLLLSMQLQ